VFSLDAPVALRTLSFVCVLWNRRVLSFFKKFHGALAASPFPFFEGRKMAGEFLLRTFFFAVIPPFRMLAQLYGSHCVISRQRWPHPSPCLSPSDVGDPFCAFLRAGETNGFFLPTFPSGLQRNATCSFFSVVIVVPWSCSSAPLALVSFLGP